MLHVYWILFVKGYLHKNQQNIILKNSHETDLSHSVTDCRADKMSTE